MNTTYDMYVNQPNYIASGTCCTAAYFASAAKTSLYIYYNAYYIVKPSRINLLPYVSSAWLIPAGQAACYGTGGGASVAAPVGLIALLDFVTGGALNWTWVCGAPSL